MLVQGSRPRQLHWYHAGPMLFGDWGTSRLYVLGLCFLHTGFASIYFMAAMALLLIAVGWAYSVICRLYPDGGGVYSSARHRSPAALAVFGALLLGADYVVTAALSALDAFHYLNLDHSEWWAAGSIALIGMINYFGPTKAGIAALVAAVLTVAFSMTIGVAATGSLHNVRITTPTGTVFTWWTSFTAIILAISGVEAVANMTGIMVEPVARTAKRAIWPVVIEIVILNLLLTFAMQSIPLDVLGDGNPDHAFTAHRDDMLRLMAQYYVGPAFAMVASAVFATLLLSAVNTAVTDLVSIQYMMARDHELPASFGGLNGWGMPVIPLLLSTLLPFCTLIAVPDVGHLADLYAIGVVGAVTVNLSCVVTSHGLDIKLWERLGMSAIALLMAAVWVSIAYEKPHALAFAGVIVVAGMSARWIAHHRQWIGQRVTEVVDSLHEQRVALPATAAGTVPATASPAVDCPRFMVATAGNPKLVKFALEQARTHQADLIFLYVRHIAVTAMGPVQQLTVHEDPDALKFFAQIREQAKTEGVSVRTIYTVANDIPGTIVDFSATFGVDRLILGATQRGNLWRTMKGDVLQGVASHLPEKTLLLIQA